MKVTNIDTGMIHSIEEFHTLLDMQRICFWFFDNPRNNWETYHAYRGFLIISSIIKFSQWPKEYITTIYMFDKIMYNITPSKPLRDIEDAKAFIDEIIHSGTYFMNAKYNYLEGI